jgi:hypothetical protein
VQAVISNNSNERWRQRACEREPEREAWESSQGSIKLGRSSTTMLYVVWRLVLLEDMVAVGWSWYWVWSWCWCCGCNGLRRERPQHSAPQRTQLSGMRYVVNHQQRSPPEILLAFAPMTASCNLQRMLSGSEAKRRQRQKAKRAEAWVSGYQEPIPVILEVRGGSGKL